MCLQNVARRIVRFMLVVLMGGLCQAVVRCNDGSLSVDLPGTIIVDGHGHDCDDCGWNWWFWGDCDDCD